MEGADAEADTKRVFKVTLGVGGGEADGISLESNSSKSDTALFLTVVGDDFRHFVLGVAEGEFAGNAALASWNSMSVKVRRRTRGGGHPKLYGYGPPLRMEVISPEWEKVDSVQKLKNSQRSTRRYMVSDKGSCCSEPEPIGKNQNMTVSCGTLSGF